MWPVFLCLLLMETIHAILIIALCLVMRHITDSAPAVFEDYR
jgi:hypothetical protein